MTVTVCTFEQATTGHHQQVHKHHNIFRHTQSNSDRRQAMARGVTLSSAAELKCCEGAGVPFFQSRTAL